jgi:hypothetical protein
VVEVETGTGSKQKGAGESPPRRTGYQNQVEGSPSSAWAGSSLAAPSTAARQESWERERHRGAALDFRFDFRYNLPVPANGADRPGSGHRTMELLRALARSESVRITVHAHQEMVEEEVTIDDILEAIATGGMIEDYPAHRRGACGLVGGMTRAGRPLHIVCTTEQPVLVIITVYEPKPPKWTTPVQRSIG